MKDNQVFSKHAELQKKNLGLMYKVYMFVQLSKYMICDDFLVTLRKCPFVIIVTFCDIKIMEFIPLEKEIFQTCQHFYQHSHFLGRLKLGGKYLSIFVLVLIFSVEQVSSGEIFKMHVNQLYVF
eukprot:TRINITY_DN4342_c0_g1_i1.p5 TRINITY_DN4342_c0_g1~~TRINITY_DN4342_c0_g1_i1.p5  ORF type:complete len:124 (-),score=1.87 TRINITY_DN4342_c0_g1_i1:297-668(-)